MKTRLLTIDAAGDFSTLVKGVARVLLEDGVMAYPTETFYGLGAAAFLPRATDKVFRLKKRDPAKPLALMASGLDMVCEITADLPPTFWVLAEEFWPGPLTLVLKASPSLPDFLAGPGRSVGVRIPPVPWIRQLVSELSQPLTATSANISGEKEMADPADVAAVFSGKVELIIDGGRTPGGAASSVVNLLGATPRLLREGMIPGEKILAALKC